MKTRHNKKTKIVEEESYHIASQQSTEEPGGATRPLVFGNSQSSQFLLITSQTFSQGLESIREGAEQATHVRITKSYLNETEEDRLSSALQDPNARTESIELSTTIVGIFQQEHLFRLFLDSKVLHALQLSPWQSDSPGQVPVMQLEDEMDDRMLWLEQERAAYQAQKTFLGTFLQFCSINTYNGIQNEKKVKLNLDEPSVAYLAVDILKKVKCFLDLSTEPCLPKKLHVHSLK